MCLFVILNTKYFIWPLYKSKQIWPNLYFLFLRHTIFSNICMHILIYNMYCLAQYLCIKSKFNCVNFLMSVCQYACLVTQWLNIKQRIKVTWPHSAVIIYRPFIMWMIIVIFVFWCPPICWVLHISSFMINQCVIKWSLLTQFSSCNINILSLY